MTYSFTLILVGPDPTEEANLDRLFAAGCDDATFGERDGVYIADFDRDGASFSDALISAVTAVESAIPGLRVIRVEPEDLVTASEIAARTGGSREGVRLLFEGRRGAGGFPRPAAWLQDRTRLWQWTKVYKWFRDHGEHLPGYQWSEDQAEWIAIANSLLTFRTWDRGSSVSRNDSAKKFTILLSKLFKDDSLVELFASVVQDRNATRRRR